MQRMLTEIRIAGFGGQGVILAAAVIGKAAAIFEGGYATMTQAFGPEARGGSSSAQVILSTEPILYPYVTQPDILVVMSQEAYTRFAPQLKPGGILITEQELVNIDRMASGIQVYGVPATRLAEELGRKMVLNIVMVGFFGAVTGTVGPRIAPPGGGRLRTASLPGPEPARLRKRLPIRLRAARQSGKRRLRRGDVAGIGVERVRNGLNRLFRPCFGEHARAFRGRAPLHLGARYATYDAEVVDRHHDRHTFPIGPRPCFGHTGPNILFIRTVPARDGLARVLLAGSP